MLKRLFGQLINGINTDLLTQEEFVMIWNHWQDKYFMYEEKLTFKEADKIEKALEKLWTELERKYPGHGATSYFK